MNKTKSFSVVGIDNSVTSLFKMAGFNVAPNHQSADVVVFIGGADLNPKLYGQEKNHPRVYFDDSFDQRDIKAYSNLFDEQIKVGICRGGQFLNVMNGGQLHQHVSGHSGPHVIHDALSNDTWMGTSCHHQMMIPNLSTAEILAYAEGIGSDFHGADGRPMDDLDIEPEIVWYEQDRALCFQGHPEWNNKEDKKRLFNLLELLT